MLKRMFESIKIGSMETKNRFVVPAMVTNYVGADGMATEKFIAYHEEKAKGGWGTIIVEDYPIMRDAGGFKTLPGLWHDGQIESHAELTERVHKHGAKIIAQIYHAGRATCSAITGVQCVAPSPYADPVIGETPRELTRDEILDIVDRFGDTALRAKKAGFDGVELHGAHGYLLNQFMSPFSNKRTDEYGGTIMNRARFALEVIENIRKKVGEDFVVFYRMSVNEFVEGGLTTEDNKVVAMILERAGVDAIHCSNSVYASAAEFGIPPAAKRHAWSSDITAEIKSVVSIPVITVGRVNDPLIAESVVASNKADLVAMGRASLADSHLPNKAKEGNYEEIIRCIGCMQGCIGRNGRGLPVKCLVNPMTGSESEINLELSENRKKVAVIGGGIAGMQAAIIAAKKGHHVHVFEKQGKLGGQWLIAAVPPSKEELNSFTVWQKTQLIKYGIDIHLNIEVNEKILKDINAEVVIIATGAEPFVPNIPGKDSKNVVLANDVLSGNRDVGDNVVVIGGGLVGAETAAHLANHGKRVTIVEMMPEIVKDCEPGVKLFLLKDLKNNEVRIMTNTAVKEIKDNSVVLSDKMDNLSELENIDTVVMAIGSRQVNHLVAELEGKFEKVVTIGDAVKVRKALDAVEEGFIAGLSI